VEPDSVDGGSDVGESVRNGARGAEIAGVRVTSVERVEVGRSQLACRTIGCAAGSSAGGETCSAARTSSGVASESAATAAAINMTCRAAMGRCVAYWSSHQDGEQREARPSCRPVSSRPPRTRQDDPSWGLNATPHMNPRWSGDSLNSTSRLSSKRSSPAGGAPPLTVLRTTSTPERCACLRRKARRAGASVRAEKVLRRHRGRHSNDRGTVRSVLKGSSHA
jgi:hypothetical protein